MKKGYYSIQALIILIKTKHYSNIKPIRFCNHKRLVKKSKGSSFHGCKNKYLKGTMIISLNNNTQPKSQDLFTHTFLTRFLKPVMISSGKVSLESNQRVHDFAHISCTTVARTTTLSGCYFSS